MPYVQLGATAVDSSVDTRDTYLVQQMHALAISIYQAQQRNDVPTVQTLRDHFKVLADEYRDRGAIGISAYDKILLGIDEWLRKAGSALRDTASEAGKNLLKGLWPFAVILGVIIVAKKELL